MSYIIIYLELSERALSSLESLREARELFLEPKGREALLFPTDSKSFIGRLLTESTGFVVHSLALFELFELDSLIL